MVFIFPQCTTSVQQEYARVEGQVEMEWAGSGRRKMPTTRDERIEETPDQMFTGTIGCISPYCQRLGMLENCGARETIRGRKERVYRTEEQ
jgi:hypothetical protein